jgi:hypothetical protein
MRSFLKMLSLGALLTQAACGGSGPSCEVVHDACPVFDVGQWCTCSGACSTQAYALDTCVDPPRATSSFWSECSRSGGLLSSCGGAVAVTGGVGSVSVPLDQLADVLARAPQIQLSALATEKGEALTGALLFDGAAAPGCSPSNDGGGLRWQCVVPAGTQSIEVQVANVTGFDSTQFFAAVYVSMAFVGTACTDVTQACAL